MTDRPGPDGPTSSDKGAQVTWITAESASIKTTSVVIFGIVNVALLCLLHVHVQKYERDSISGSPLHSHSTRPPEGDCREHDP
jgi:hypothetical protein